MSALGPILLYLLAIAVAAGLVAPLLRSAFSGFRRIPLASLSVATGFPVALAVFALLARFAPDYRVSLGCLLVGGGAAAAWLWRRQRGRTDLPVRDATADRVLLIGFTALLITLVQLRSLWGAITWDNFITWSGSEKLFNLSMIQAFTVGSGFPPENLWNATQPIDYYALMHALPGLVAWGWRMLTGDAAAAGVLFVFSDAFLVAVAALAIAAWCHALLPRPDEPSGDRAALLLAILVSAGTLLSTNASAIYQVLATLGASASANWEVLQRGAVPYNYSQYPIWTLIQGDHHSFQRSAVAQVALLGAMALLLTAKRVAAARALLVGTLAAAVAMWHAGSVLLDLAVLLPAALALIAWRAMRGQGEQALALTGNAALAALVAATIAGTFLIGRQSPEMRWYAVSLAEASPLGGFLSAQAGPLLLIGLLGCLAIVGSRSVAVTPDEPGIMTRLRSPYAIGGAILAAVLAVIGHGGLAVALGCAVAIAVCAPASRGVDPVNHGAMIVLAIAGLMIWVLPEFVVGDMAHRRVVEWKRWQTTMRFWLEGYWLLPFLAALALGPKAVLALRSPAIPWKTGAAFALACALWVSAHVFAVGDRLDRWPDRADLNGFGLLERQGSCDNAVIGQLRALPGRVQLGELCGTGEVLRGLPVEYDWPGRLAAYSGRPGVCGWTMHVWQNSVRWRGGGDTGPWTWVRIREYERAAVLAYGSAAADVVASGSRDRLRRFGVTHLAVGEHERRLFPGLTAQRAADSLGAKLAFTTADGCGLVDLANDQPKN